MNGSEETRRENAFVLEALSRYLCQTPRAITEDMMRDMEGACGGDMERAYSLLLASLCGLDVADNPAHRALYRDAFARIAKKLDAAVYRRDPYYRTVRIDGAREGAWETRMEAYAPFEAFVRDDLAVLPNGRVLPRLGFFAEEFRFPAVLEEGREWMWITPNEIETMREPVAQSRGRVLTYGLGLGYFAFMAARKGDVESVTVVERDASVIRLFAKHILPQLPCRDKIRVIEADAFDFASRDMARGRYDVVFTDLWRDPSDGVELYRAMKRFEPLSPSSRFLYWIERTLQVYL